MLSSSSPHHSSSSPPRRQPSISPSHKTQQPGDSDRSRYHTSFSIKTCQAIKDAKRQVQTIVRSITSVEVEKLGENLRQLATICQEILTTLEKLNTMDTFRQISPPYVAMELKNLRYGMSTLLNSQHESSSQILRRVFINFQLFAFFLSAGEVTVKLAVESMLKTFFAALTTSNYKALDHFALLCLNDISDPLERCKFMLFMLQETKGTISFSPECKSLIDKIVADVPLNDEQGRKMIETVKQLLQVSTGNGFEDLKRSGSGESIPSPGIKKDKQKRGGPKIAIHDCRLECSRVRNQKSNKLQLEILVVLDMQCANCDLAREGVGSYIAHQTGLFVKEAVLRSKDMRMSVMNSLSPVRNRFEADGSSSRKRSREESSTDDDCDDTENYAPSPSNKSRSRHQDSDLFPPSVPSSADAGAQLRCELAGIKTKSPQRLAPPALGTATSRGEFEGERTHRFEATKSWPSGEPVEGSDAQHTSIKISGDLSKASDVLNEDEHRADPQPSREDAHRPRPRGADTIQSGFLTEASSAPFVPPMFPTPSASPTESCSEADHSSHQAQSSSLGGGLQSRTENDAMSSESSSDSSEVAPTTASCNKDKMSPIKPPQKVVRPHELEEDEDDEVVSPNSRTLLHPVSRIPTQIRSTSTSSRRSDSFVVCKDVTTLRKGLTQFPQTYTDRRTTPPPAFCSTPSHSSRIDLRNTHRVPERNTLTTIPMNLKSPSMVEIPRTPTFMSRRSLLTPMASKQGRRNVTPDPIHSPVSAPHTHVPQTPSSIRRQSTVSHTSREPLVKRQRSRASATSPMSSSMLSSSPSMKTPRETEVLVPFAVMNTQILGLLVTCLGDCTNLGTSRKSSAVKQRNVDASVVPHSSEILREELESHNPADPLVLGLIQARTKGGMWLLHHNLLQALRRISLFHADTLEQFTQLSSLYLLLAKSMECLRSSISRKALEVTKDFFTPANSNRRRVLDTGVAYMLPACLKKASDQSNLFLAEAAVNAYEAIVQTASELICMSTLKPLINTAISSGQRWHIFRATALVTNRLQGRVATIIDIDKVITFAVKGLRDASSDSRCEARNLCVSLTKCLDLASPTVVSRIRTKVKPEDWARLTGLH